MLGDTMSIFFFKFRIYITLKWPHLNLDELHTFKNSILQREGKNALKF